MKPKRILIACELSGVVRSAFRKRGHDAWSNDLEPCDDGSPFHIQGDCITAITSGWDMIIMHPMCTALAVSGNSTYGRGMPKHHVRLRAGRWTLDLWNHATKHAKFVAMENPVGVLSGIIGRPAQIIHPWQFGHMEQKKTCLWLRGLPELLETNNVYEEMMKLPKNQRERLHYLPPSLQRSKVRSKTFQGLADAMADQWGAVQI